MTIGLLNTRQTWLAHGMGGFSISRLLNAQAKSIPIDFICSLCEWVEANKINAAWLMTGSGPMMKE